MSKLSDEWCTPDWLFDELNQEFNFDIDLCGTDENSKCNFYGKDYLNDVYASSVIKNEVTSSLPLINPKINTAFMNPPYSNPKPFIEKAWEDSKYCKIACLVKCDPSTRWWATFWNYKQSMYCPLCFNKPIRTVDNLVEKYTCCNQEMRHFNLVSIKPGPKPGCEVRFFPKRIKFDPPKGWGGKATSSSFPCALLMFDRRSIND